MGGLSKASVKPFITAAAVAAWCAVTQAQWLNYKTPDVPRLPDGRPNLSAPVPRLSNGNPDLSGLWQPACVGTMPCWQESLFFDLAKDLRPADVEMTPWAKGIADERERREHVDDPYGYCLPPGVPRINNLIAFKLVPTPTLTAILYETSVGLMFRQVFTDGRPLPEVTEPTWLGYSVGRWDGETFVSRVSASGTAGGSTRARHALIAARCGLPSGSIVSTLATWSCR